MQTTSTITVADHRKSIMGCTFVLLAATGFSAKAVLIKLSYGASSKIDPITLMGLRMLLALPFFLMVAAWGDKNGSSQDLQTRDWLMIFGLGVLGYYLASYLDFEGLQYIPAGLERLIVFMYPTFVVIFSAVLYRRAISRSQAIALVLSYAGMLLVFMDSMSIDSRQEVWLGSTLVLASAIVFAFFMMGSGFMIKRIGSRRFTAYSMTVACLATGLHYTTRHGLNTLEISAEIYWLALMMAIFSTVMPAFLMNAGIRRIGVDTASILSSAGPIGTLVLAFLLLGEEVTVVQLFGTLFVLAGVYVISRPQKRERGRAKNES